MKERWIGYASICFDPKPAIGLAALYPDVGQKRCDGFSRCTSGN
ncbi:Uncharacterised protein [Vibrio cholerae]|nr:Uncharacterised protein [Vibrio cholerae]